LAISTVATPLIAPSGGGVAGAEKVTITDADVLGASKFGKTPNVNSAGNAGVVQRG
jgi:hypothetical protein